MSDDPEPESALTPFDVIFSCSVCQATIGELYRDVPEGVNDGCHGGPAPRLWLAECGHLSCGSHFEGGGVSFYPEDGVPMEPCTVCIAETGNSIPRRVFRIVPDAHKNHDNEIPNEFFQMPPIQLDNRGPRGMQALRFQYLQLTRYGVFVTKKLNDAKDQLAAESQQVKTLLQANHYLEQKNEEIEKRLKHLEGPSQDSQAMHDRIKQLEKNEKNYKAFKEREPEIRHYLKAVQAMGKELALLREQLRTLGYDVPQIDYAWNPNDLKEVLPTRAEAHEKPNGKATDARRHRVDHITRERDSYNGVTTASPRTLSRAAGMGPMDRTEYPLDENSGSSGRKRGHREYVDDAFRQAFHTTEKNFRDEDLIPPPARPVNYNISTSRAVAQPTHRREIDENGIHHGGVLDIYNNGRWKKADDSQSSDRELSRLVANNQRRVEQETNQYPMSEVPRPSSLSLNGRVADISIHQEYADDGGVPLRRAAPRHDEGDTPYLRHFQPQVDTTQQSKYYSDHVTVGNQQPRDNYSQIGRSRHVLDAFESSAFVQPAVTMSRRQTMPLQAPERPQPAYQRPPTQSRYFNQSNGFNFPETPCRPQMTANGWAPMPTQAITGSVVQVQTARGPQHRRSGNVMYRTASRMATAVPDFRMQPAQPSWESNRSLNSLSFMQNAYTSANEPIFNSGNRQRRGYDVGPSATNDVVMNVRGARTGRSVLGNANGRPSTDAYGMNGDGSRYPSQSRSVFSRFGWPTGRR